MSIPRRWRLLALLIGPVMLTLGLASVMNYYSYQVAVRGYEEAAGLHEDTIRTAFEANAISSDTLQLIKAITEEVHARREGRRTPEDWPAFRRVQQTKLADQRLRLQALLNKERDPERLQALKNAMVFTGDLDRFLATSDELMKHPWDEVSRRLLASRNMSLRYAVELQRFNDAMSQEGMVHLLEAQAAVETYSTRSTIIAGAGLLVAAVLWGIAAVVLARRVETLDNAMRGLANRADGEDRDRNFAAVRQIARTKNPLTSTLAQSILTLQRVQHERDEAQVALQEREQLFATLVQQAPAGVALVSRDTLRMLRFNEAAYRSLGYDADRFAALSLYDIAFGRRDEVDKTVAQACARDGIEFEATIRTQSGELRDYWISLKPLTLPDRDCISAIWLDITARRQAEFELERHRRHLEALVGERTRDLERTQQDLIAARDMAESASRAKSAFLANMSHEIRTPMNAIVGMAHLLKGEPLSARQRERVDKITGAAMHLLAVINDILDFSKIEAGKFSIDPTDFNLEQVISQAFSLVADKAEAKDLELVSDLDHVPTALHGDPVRLGQILLNLLSNAVKFTEHGHVQLRVRAVLREDDTRPWLRFEVTDTGIGISAEQQARLFTAFQQADQSTTRLYGGTGLGLAICGRLTDLLGGSIGVDSTPGKGSTFWVELPFTTATYAPPVLTSFPPGARVLVLDDMEEAREAVRMVLSQLGATSVDICERGQAGLARVQAAEQAGTPYTHVFADWNMPGMSGAEVLRQLRRMPLKAYPVGILFSGSSGAPEGATPEEGIDAFIAKPILPSAVVSALARMAAMAPPEALAVVAAAPGLPLTKTGQRILVAEDNPLNREVLCELLERLGLHVDTVTDGAEAVDAARQVHYDLILMDLQMPRMDGLAATRALRQLPAYQATPIIAVTANTFVEDRTSALAAGMNDHLAKPVDPAALHTVLDHWLGASLTPVAAPAPASASSEEADVATLERIPGLSVANALRHTGGSARQLRDRLGRFFEEHRDDPARLCDEAAEGRIGDARRRAHTLRGVALTFGLDAIGQAAQAIEAGLPPDSAATDLVARPDMLKLVAAMRAAHTGFMALPASTLGSPVPAGPHAELSEAELTARLTELATQLTMGDMDAMDAWDRLAPSLPSRYPEQSRPLTDALGRFDFAKAHTIVRDLMDRHTADSARRRAG